MEGIDTYYKDKEGKISATKLSPYGKRMLNQLEGTPIHFSDIGWAKIKNGALVTEEGKKIDKINNDRMVNKIIFRII
jgi:hypothetical protein